MAPNVIATDLSSDSLPMPKDLSNLFVPSMRGPIKSAFKSVMGNPTLAMINMAGGVPHPNTFPILQLQATVKAQKSTSTTRSESMLLLDKTRRSQTTESLDELLQYGDGCGADSYCNFLYRHTQRVHNPQYADWGVIASCGNTDSIGKAVALFCQPGDSILVERWTFPGTLSSLRAAGVAPVSVALDNEGMVPEDLDRACREWSGSTPPRAVYLVPTGQNPTGATMSLVRRKSIYAVAQKHNLAIIEDDPYYFLQLPEFVAPAPSTAATADDSINGTTATVSAAASDYSRPQSLVPSLLSMDIDGRVIRLDSFSKILAPNLRCGWITAPRYILDKIQILNETTTLQPSGLSQGLISKMLNEVWGMDGWNAHLQELRTVYTKRRNMFIQMVEKHLAGLVEYSVPMAGMFVWMKINFGSAAADQTAMPRLLDAMKKCGVMMAPGMPFSSNGPSPSDHYLRAAFALVDVEMFEPALVRLAQAITGISGRAPTASSDSVKVSLIVPTRTSVTAVNSSG
ncbi:hypothetical protein LPJ73_000098 [Coemansia sp. RSA 2703]|nr:hypothetical protein LPJ73_000098 [Coemansia sp. RSA 2703]KAJ2379470.1 hypothetical protein IW150_000151 [Coemansia sp. RSA 2607]KAJ2398374.1 hypothetical protein GGI05_000120 [Coemansia sp. RSA 2603]